MTWPQPNFTLCLVASEYVSTVLELSKGTTIPLTPPSGVRFEPGSLKSLHKLAAVHTVKSW